MNTMTVDLTDLLIYDDGYTTVTVTTVDGWTRNGEAMGLSGMALEAYVASGASVRHSQRIKAVKQAALSAVANLPYQKLAAAIILDADAYGVGGPALWPDGSGSRRIPCLSGIAAAKQAAAGCAWDAAIGVAKADLLLKAAGISICSWERREPINWLNWLPEKSPHTGEMSLFVGVLNDYSPQAIAVEETFVPPEWQFTIVANQLKKLIDKATLTEEEREIIPNWSELYNRLYDACSCEE